MSDAEDPADAVKHAEPAEPERCLNRFAVHIRLANAMARLDEPARVKGAGSDIAVGALMQSCFYDGLTDAEAFTALLEALLRRLRAASASAAGVG